MSSTSTTRRILSSRPCLRRGLSGDRRLRSPRLVTGALPSQVRDLSTGRRDAPSGAAEQLSVCIPGHRYQRNPSASRSTRAAVDPSRVVVVRNGPPARMMRAPREGRDGVLEAPILAFVGGLGSQDGVMELPHLLTETGLETARLLIIGDGPCRRGMEETAIRLGVADRVQFTGRVSHREVDDLLAISDICIDPAPCTELNHGSTMIKSRNTWRLDVPWSPSICARLGTLSARAAS